MIINGTLLQVVVKQATDKGQPAFNKDGSPRMIRRAFVLDEDQISEAGELTRFSFQEIQETALQALVRRPVALRFHEEHWTFNNRSGST